MKREDDQQLWDLLGRAAEPRLSPFFARNVTRAIRQEPASRSGWLRTWLGPRKLIPAAALAVAMVAGLMATHYSARQIKPADAIPDVLAKIDPQDYDVVADLDELLAPDENNLWDDDTQTL
jgi:Predicted integral membrane protein (DUF2275)